MAQHASGTRRLALSGASRVPGRLRVVSTVVAVPHELNFTPKARFYFVPCWRNSTIFATFFASRRSCHSQLQFERFILRKQSMTKAEVVVGLLESLGSLFYTVRYTKTSGPEKSKTLNRVTNPADCVSGSISSEPHVPCDHEPVECVPSHDSSQAISVSNPTESSPCEFRSDESGRKVVYTSNAQKHCRDKHWARLDSRPHHEYTGQYRVGNEHKLQRSLTSKSAENNIGLYSANITETNNGLDSRPHHDYYNDYLHRITSTSCSAP